MDLAQSLTAQIRAALDERPSPFIVAICGWADTGKSTLAIQLCGVLGHIGIQAEAISTDDFMLDRAERHALGISGYDVRSINVQALQSALTHFVKQHPFSVYSYDNRTGTKSPLPKVVAPANVLIVEGIHALHADCVHLMNLKVFIDSDEATLRQMRYCANMLKRGMTSQQATTKISKEWDDYCASVRPCSKMADFVVQVDTDFKYACPRLAGILD